MQINQIKILASAWRQSLDLSVITRRSRCHPSSMVSMATAAWRRGGCVHVRGHCTHQRNKRENAHALSLPKNEKHCAQRGKLCHEWTSLGTRRRANHALLVFLAAMSDEIQVGGGGNKLATATPRDATLPAGQPSCSTGVQTSGLAQKNMTDPSTEIHRIQQHSTGWWLGYCWKIKTHGVHTHHTHTTHAHNELECSCLQHTYRTGCRW